MKRQHSLVRLLFAVAVAVAVAVALALAVALGLASTPAVAQTSVDAAAPESTAEQVPVLRVQVVVTPQAISVDGAPVPDLVTQTLDDGSGVAAISDDELRGQIITHLYDVWTRSARWSRIWRAPTLDFRC